MADRKWLEFLLGRRTIPGLIAPPLPDVAIQSQFVGSCGAEAFVEAATFCAKLSDAASTYLFGLRSDCRILDFGVGWGRLYRVLLNHVDPANLIGVDIDQACIDLCRQAMPFGSFARNEARPPLPFDDESFEIAYAYSVLSHLAPEVSRAWLSDIRRVLRPGGLLVFTTLKTAHLDVWRAQARDGVPYYATCLEDAGFDHAEWSERAARGEALYLPIGGGGLRDASFYGETIIAEPAARRLADETGYVLRQFEDGTDLPQSFVVLQRRPPLSRAG